MLKDLQPSFFPSSSNRTILEFARSQFPFPLALTYTRLQDYLDAQAPIRALLQLKDAFETSIKFCSAVSVAALLRRGQAPSQSLLVATLLKPQGLSGGDWLDLLEASLLDVPPEAPDSSAACRLPTTLRPLFHESSPRKRPRPTALLRLLRGTPDSFLAWRNRLAHGAFRFDLESYARETLTWLDRLHTFYTAIAPVFAEWTLLSIGADRRPTRWEGTADLPYCDPLQHVGAGLITPLYLLPRAEVPPLVPDASLDTSLSLDPLIALQRCDVCAHDSVFFFEKGQYDVGRDRTRATFLEYFGGHEVQRTNLPDLATWVRLLPPRFRWERASYDGVAIDSAKSVAFADFATQYLRPGWLLDRLWSATNATTSGYLVITGEGGSGKSFLVRGLALEAHQQGYTALSYYIQPGPLGDYRTFLVELAAAARAALPIRTQEPQTRTGTIGELRRDFTAYLSELVRANRSTQLLIIIDGLDALSAPTDATPVITALLPDPAQLPEDCHIILSGRPDMHRDVQRDMARLNPVPVILDTHSPEHGEVLRSYIEARLPERLRSEDSIERVFRRSAGLFLSAYLLCDLLNSQLFDTANDLPSDTALLSEFLARLEHRLGGSFATTHGTALALLMVAQRPVTTEQLKRWGIPSSHLEMVLADLRVFLRAAPAVARHPDLAPGDAFEITHDSLRTSSDPRLPTPVTSHAAIVQSAIARHRGHWEDLDLDDRADLYDLCFLRQHALLAGVPALEPSEVSGFAAACLAGRSGLASGDPAEALALSDQAYEVLVAEIPDGASTSWALRLAQLAHCFAMPLSRERLLTTATQHDDGAGDDTLRIAILRSLSFASNGDLEAAMVALPQNWPYARLAPRPFSRFPPGSSISTIATSLELHGALAMHLMNWEVAAGNFEAAAECRNGDWTHSQDHSLLERARGHRDVTDPPAKPEALKA